MPESTVDTTESTPRIRRSDERGVQDLGWSVNRMTFSFADYYDPDWMRFGPLRVLIESRIDPNEGFSEHPHRHAEIVSYVTEGPLRHLVLGQVISIVSSVFLGNRAAADVAITAITNLAAAGLLGALIVTPREWVHAAITLLVLGTTALPFITGLPTLG